MDKLLHTQLPLHGVAIFCLAAVFFAFRWGYAKKERDITRERTRIWKEEQAKLPKAIR